MKNKFVFCERCGAKLKTHKGGEYNIIWLEYDQRTGTYTNKEVPAEFSQGGFPFGKDCAKIVLSETLPDLQAVSTPENSATSQAESTPPTQIKTA